MASGAKATPDAGQAEAGPPQDGAGGGLDFPELESSNYPLMIVGVMAASLLQILDTTIANVALPHMQSSLGATVDTITWVLTSYIIASAVALPLTGWLADRIGARTLFIGSVAGFILTSMVKRVDLAVLSAFNGVRPGVTALGLKEGALDYAMDEHNAKLVTPQMRKKVEAAKADIVTGRLKVVDYTVANACR